METVWGGRWLGLGLGLRVSSINLISAFVVAAATAAAASAAVVVVVVVVVVADQRATTG